MNNMWKSKTNNGNKSIATKVNQNIQHLSPFASHSSAESATPSSSATTTPSPRTQTELPVGIRYIRQTPTSIYRSVPTRQTSVGTQSQPTTRSKSPAKNLRFADPLLCAKKADKTQTTATKSKSSDTERGRTLNRPVIKSTTNVVDAKKWPNKSVATSPATRQTSPIFSTIDFSGDNKGVTKQTSDSSIPSGKQCSSDSSPTPSSSQTKTLIEIKTPNGTVKRSTLMAPNNSTTGNNNNVHRNTLTFPIQHSIERKCEPNRLSVNVNVAVGVDCNNHNNDNNRHSLNNHIIEPKFDNQLIDDLNDKLNQYVDNSGDDEVDWTPAEAGKGFALKVAVRLRPFIQSEIDSQNDISVINMNQNTIRIINSDNDNYNRLEFGFDVCLNSTDRDLFEYADQDSVFYKMGQPLLERALEGYNVCLFAYGQTGSGKSFTMMGTESNPGIIPRFVYELFKRSNIMSGVVFGVEVSYFEIYNEKIYDLLSDDKNNNKKTLRIREHPQNGPYVENLSQHEVENYDEVMQVLANGNRRRATAWTAANEGSSRSHSIFTIILSQLRKSEEMGLDISCSCGSRINLIDLAGSERVGYSAHSEERFKEGSHINKSLLNLGKVISKLADLGSHPNKFAHIPYRDSALTWLLKDSLGGNSRTSMIATISPAKCHLEETLSTLRYAATARRIVNYVHINEDPKSKKIRELLEEIAYLKQMNNNLDNKSSSNEMTDEEVVVFDKSKANNELQIEKQTKKVETISKSTNTSFVNNRRMSTKSTDTSFAQNKVKTCNIATNTSFVGTKPVIQTCSTGTTTSFLISKNSTSTATTYVDLPTRMDLLRTKQLEAEQNKLLEEIRRQRQLILGEISPKAIADSQRNPQEFEELSERSDTNSDLFYDCKDVVDKTEPTVPKSIDKSEHKSKNKKHKNKKKCSISDKKCSPINEERVENNNTWDLSVADLKDENNTDEWSTGVDTTDQNDSKTKDNKKRETLDDWGTETTPKSLHKREDDWTKDSTQAQGNCDDWADEQNDWTEEVVTKTDSKPKETDWGTDETKKTEYKSKSEENWNEEENWGNGSTQKGSKCDEWTEETSGAKNDWNEDNTENSEQKDEDFDWGSEQTDTTVIDKNETKDDCDWGTDGKDQSNDWGNEPKGATGGEDDWGTDIQQSSGWGEDPKGATGDEDNWD